MLDILIKSGRSDHARYGPGGLRPGRGAGAYRHTPAVVNRDFHQGFVPWEPDLSVEARVVIKGGKWMV